MQNVISFKKLIALWLIAAVISGTGWAATEGKIKVHKQFITVSGPDEKGMVRVVGSAGAIESSSPATAWLIKPDTKEKVVLTVNADGSFEGSIAAKMGDKIKVLAKNMQKKQSYGTFTVGKAQK